MARDAGKVAPGRQRPAMTGYGRQCGTSASRDLPVAARLARTACIAGASDARSTGQGTASGDMPWAASAPAGSRRRHYVVRRQCFTW
jgi:hypothetical protein